MLAAGWKDWCRVGSCHMTPHVQARLPDATKTSVCNNTR